MADEMRVQKFLSKAGVCSRRTAEKWMKAGRVSVNGAACREMGAKVDPRTDRVEVDGKIVTLPDSYVYLLMNKPIHTITSMDDPEDRPVVVDLLPEKMPRVWPVGRLDWDSEGLLILTNDGKLTNLLTHPSHEVSKTYAVKVRGLIQPESEVLKSLREGIRLEDGMTAPARVVVTRDNGRNTWLEVILHEGRNRQIRRMFEAVGYPVMKLRRIAIGPITIEGIGSGTYRAMTHAEVQDLYAEVEAAMPPRAIPSSRALRREQEAIDRGNLPDS